MGRRNRFEQGAIIRDPIIVLSHAIAGRYIYWNHKPQHPSWICSMQINTIIGAARRGIIREAIERTIENGE